MHDTRSAVKVRGQEIESKGHGVT